MPLLTMDTPNTKPRMVGSLLSRQAPREVAPVSAPAPDGNGLLASAIIRQAEGIERLAETIAAQRPPVVNVQAAPAPAPRRYLITVNKDKDKLPVSYLVEPLASTGPTSTRQ